MLIDRTLRSFAASFERVATGARRRSAPRPMMRVLAAGIVLGATLSAGVSSALAATPLTSYTLARVDSQDPQSAGRWSERLATVPDFNHDGVNELLVADLNESYGGFSQAGRVYMQDGKTRKIMYSVDAPEIQAGAHFGFFISVIGDVNGDGVADFAAGTDAQNVDASGASCTKGTPGCVAGQGKAWVFSGANGRMLYALSNPNPQAAARFGSRLGRAGDINHDGVQDIIVGASGSDMPTGCGHDQTTGKALAAIPAGCRVGEGAAYIFSGKDGSLIRTLHLPAADEAPAPCKSSCGSFGLAAQGPGDMNGDGATDQLVDAGSFNYDTATQRACTDQLAPTCNKGQGAEYVFSGKDGSVIRRTDDPSPQKGAFFGFQDVEPLAPGDVNGDGVPDYFANGFEQNGPPPGNLDSAGRAWVFSGKTGALLYEVKTPTPTAGGQFGFAMVKTDYDRDGDSDLYVGASPHHTSGTGIDQSGGTHIFDGKTGALLKSLVLPPSDAQSGDTLPNGDDNNGSNLGWTVAAPGDLNGDGQPDYVAGSPFEDVGGAGLPLNCQAPTPGCVKDVGREYFFYSNVPALKPPPPRGHRVNVKRVIIHAHKRRVAHGNTLVTFNGTVVVPSFLTKSRVCYGSLHITFKHGGRVVATGSRGLSRRCTFTGSKIISDRKLHNDGGRIFVRFGGNGRLFAKGGASTGF